MDKKLKQYLTAGEIWDDPNGGQIWINTKKEGCIHLLDIRGWGHIQNMFPMNEAGQNQAAKFQDSISDFVANAIKEKIERDCSK